MLDSIHQRGALCKRRREQKMIFEPMDRIVFAGDSVTDMGSAQPVGEGLFDNVGQSYVRIIENMLSTWYPEVYLRVTNSGVSGNTSRDLLQRFDSDVVALNPDWVSICIGINDGSFIAARVFSPFL